MWLSFTVAVRLLTNFSLFTPDNPSRADIRRSIILFPLIGALLGVLYGAVWVIANRIWSTERLVPAALTFAFSALLTGGRGVGGIGRLGDAIAGIYSSGDRVRAEAAIGDQHRGTVGVVATVAFAGIKLAFLSALPEASAWQCLIVAAMAGQWATGFCFSAFRLTSSWNNEDESSRGFTDAGLNEFFGSTILAIAFAAIMPVTGLVALMAAAFVVGPAAQSLSKALNGLNHHVSFALGELGEIVALAVFSAHFA